MELLDTDSRRGTIPMERPMSNISMQHREPMGWKLKNAYGSAWGFLYHSCWIWLKTTVVISTVTSCGSCIWWSVVCGHFIRLMSIVVGSQRSVLPWNRPWTDHRCMHQHQKACIRRNFVNRRCCLHWANAMFWLYSQKMFLFCGQYIRTVAITARLWTSFESWVMT